MTYFVAVSATGGVSASTVMVVPVAALKKLEAMAGEPSVWFSWVAMLMLAAVLLEVIVTMRTTDPPWIWMLTSAGWTPS